MAQLNLNTVRCEALFASALQRSEDADARRVRAVILAAVRQFGTQGCAARVAQEFGDHPEAALARMRWAREVVGGMYGLDPIQAWPQPAPAPAPVQGRPERTAGHGRMSSPVRRRVLRAVGEGG